MKNRYGSDAKLLFTDTDSLCYDIKIEDFYQDMYTCKEEFDLSDMKIEKSKILRIRKLSVNSNMRLRVYLYANLQD